MIIYYIIIEVFKIDVWWVCLYFRFSLAKSEKLLRNIHICKFFTPFPHLENIAQTRLKKWRFSTPVSPIFYTNFSQTEGAFYCFSNALIIK